MFYAFKMFLILELFTELVLFLYLVQMPAPVHGIKITQSDTSANVTWNIETSVSTSSYITQIVIYLNGKEHQTISRRTQFHITGLKPCTQNTVGVQTQDGSLQKSRRVSIRFKTNEAGKRLTHNARLIFNCFQQKTGMHALISRILVSQVYNVTIFRFGTTFWYRYKIASELGNFRRFWVNTPYFTRNLLNEQKVRLVRKSSLTFPRKEGAYRSNHDGERCKNVTCYEIFRDDSCIIIPSKCSKLNCILIVECAKSQTEQFNGEKIRLDLLIPLVISVLCFLLLLGVIVYQRRLIQINIKQPCHKCEASENSERTEEFGMDLIFHLN